MSDEWYEIAWINFTKAVLHGCTGQDNMIERTLTHAERERVYNLNDRHEAETKALLRELAQVIP